MDTEVSLAGSSTPSSKRGRSWVLTAPQLLERFTSRRDASAELAFEALVHRHGPMVFRVCRAVLRDPHDAYDAFQATFLVLVKKARGLWVRQSLGPWLQQVAHGTASRSRLALARRRRREQRAEPPPQRNRLTGRFLMTSGTSSMEDWAACRSVTARPSCSACWRASARSRRLRSWAVRSAQSIAGWRVGESG